MNADELAAWLARIATRDEPAMAALYQATLGQVYGLALRITGARHLAEEVTADVYVQVWRTAARYDITRSAPLSWLLMLCRSRALDALRAKDDTLADAEGGEVLEQQAGGADPQDLLAATEAGSRVHAQLAALAARERQMIALAFFQGLSHAEIADHLGLPLGTVKSSLRRALQRMRAPLKEVSDE